MNNIVVTEYPDKSEWTLSLRHNDESEAVVPKEVAVAVLELQARIQLAVNTLLERD